MLSTHTRAAAAAIPPAVGFETGACGDSHVTADGQLQRAVYDQRTATQHQTVSRDGAFGFYNTIAADGQIAVAARKYCGRSTFSTIIQNEGVPVRYGLFQVDGAVPAGLP
ncbi:MAG: hypothetical protein V2B19_09270, partial [Pseudomonadota bacterium]